MKRLLYALAAFGLIASANAVQNELVPPVAGIFTGPQWSQKVGDAFRSIAGCNKGPTAPANVDGSTVDGLCWIDDSAGVWILRRYVNGAWAIEGAFDSSTSSYAGMIGGGLGSIASGTTTDLGTVPQANITISGTTTITSFGSTAPAGVVKFIRFSGILILTHSSSLTVPGGFPLTTAANDRAVVTHLGSGNWEITQYTRDSGIPIDSSAVGKADFSFRTGVPQLHVRGDGSALTRTSYPAYLAKVTRAQNGTRTSSNATITGIADTTGFGVGMPVESTAVNAGCTLASFVANTSITLNSSSCVTGSGTSTVTVFLTGYGSGGSSTTVGVPDCQGRTLAGRDPSSTNLSNATALNSSQGSQSQTLLRTDLPNVAPTFAGTSGAVNVTSGSIVAVSNALTGGSTTNGPGLLNQQIGSSGTFTPVGNVQSLNGGVTQTTFSLVQPIVIADCVIRVIP